jgi:hypothetical protein
MWCTVAQHHTTAPQHHSTTASQHHSITASQYHSITARQHKRQRQKQHSNKTSLLFSKPELKNLDISPQELSKAKAKRPTSYTIRDTALTCLRLMPHFFS